MELEQYLRILGKRWWLIVLLMVVAAIGSYLATARQPLSYRSTATLLLSPALTREALLADPATVTERLASTYARYLKTNAFARLVVEQSDLDLSPNDLVRSIDARVVGGTQFFEISATRNTPEDAQRVASVVTEYFIREILNQQREQERVRQATGTLTEQQLALVASLEADRSYYESEIADLRVRVQSLEAQGPSESRNEALTDARAQLSSQEEKLLQVLTNLVTLQPTVDTRQVNSITLIEAAPLSSTPLSRGILQNVLFALSAAAVLGFALAIGLEYLDFTLRTPEMLDEAYGMPTLGVLTRLKGTQAPPVANDLIVLTHPRSASAEAFRALRTNIQFSSAERPLTSLVVTSAAPSEGKTTVACNLAVVMAQAGKKVILVDSDLRRPMVHKHFGLDNRHGFTSLIIADAPVDQLSLDDHLQPTTVENLSILPSGPIPPNPAELLSLGRTQEVQQRLSQAADIVIYDTPPVITVTDAVILASRSDGVLQVVQSGQTRRDLVIKARQVLERVGARILGPVLNQVRQKDVGYYYYYYSPNHYTSAATPPAPPHSNGGPPHPVEPPGAAVGPAPSVSWPNRRKKG